MRPRTDAYAYLDQENVFVRLAGFSERVGVVANRESWASEAECRGMDSDLWFPTQGDSTKLAKDVCDECLVQLECLEYAIEASEPGGIWGGLASKNRLAVKRKMLSRELGLVDALLVLGYRIQARREKEFKRRQRAERDDLVEAV